MVRGLWAALFYNGPCTGCGKEVLLTMSIATTMPIMLTQVVAMFIMMMIGAALYKAKLVDNTGSAQIASVALYVATPAVILQSLATSFDPAKLAAGAACFALSFLFTALSRIRGMAVFPRPSPSSAAGHHDFQHGLHGHPARAKRAGRAVRVLHFRLHRGTGPTHVDLWCVARLAGYGKYFAQEDSHQPLGDCGCGRYRAVLLLGEPGRRDPGHGSRHGQPQHRPCHARDGDLLAQTDLRSLARDRNLYAASALRLLAVPALVIASLVFVPLDTAVKLVVVIALSAPCGTVSAMFPQLFGGDYRFGAGLVSLSTLLRSS